MDKEGIEKMGVEPLKLILRRLGGWPALEGDKWQAEEGYVWYEQVRHGCLVFFLRFKFLKSHSWIGTLPFYM